MYIEGGHFIIMSLNPLQYENRQDNERLYTYDSARHTFVFREGSWDRRPDTIRRSLTGTGQMQRVGKWDTDSLRMALQQEQQGKGL